MTSRRWIDAGAHELGEPAFWPSAAIVASAGLYADLPARFIVGQASGVFGIARWVVPALTVVLLLALVATAPGARIVRRLDVSRHRLHVTRRVLSLTMIAIVSAANAASIAWLVHLLVNGASANASTLLRAAVHMWAVNVLLFALWFWQLDGGGPAERPTCDPADRDFLFPQHTDPRLLRPGWRPLFLDYLYLSFTNAAAFSPTDTMPLTRWAKMLMLIESAISLTLGVMVVARAVNILR